MTEWLPRLEAGSGQERHRGCGIRRTASPRKSGHDKQPGLLEETNRHISAASRARAFLTLRAKRRLKQECSGVAYSLTGCSKLFV